MKVNITEKRELKEEKDLYNIDTWLRKTLWSLKGEGKLPLLVEIKIKRK